MKVKSQGSWHWYACEGHLQKSCRGGFVFILFIIVLEGFRRTKCISQSHAWAWVAALRRTQPDTVHQLWQMETRAHPGDMEWGGPLACISHVPYSTPIIFVQVMHCNVGKKAGNVSCWRRDFENEMKSHFPFNFPQFVIPPPLPCLPQTHSNACMHSGTRSFPCSSCPFKSSVDL